MKGKVKETKKKTKEKEIVIKRTSKGFIISIIIISAIFFTLFGIIFMLGIVNFDDGIYTKFDVGTTGNVLIKDKVQIYNIESFIDQDKYTIEGYLKNISDKDFEFVTIEYTLYDNDGVIIDRISSTMDNLEAGKKWNFTVDYSGINKSSISAYELTKVTIY